MIIAGIAVCNFVSSVYIWKDKATRNKSHDKYSLIKIYTIVSLIMAIYPIVHLIKGIILENADNSIFTLRSADSPTSNSRKIALVAIGMSALGGLPMMALTAFVGLLVWALYQADGETPSHSLGMTLVHKILGGKGKK